MTDIRKYIDLVKSLEEGFMQPVQPRAFGRMGASPPKPQEPIDAQKRTELARCRQYRSAEDYDAAENRYYPLSADSGPLATRNAEEESEYLKARWNHWRHLGYY